MASSDRGMALGRYDPTVVANARLIRRIERGIADSDDLARVYRFDVARQFRDDLARLSDLISPGERGVLAGWFLAPSKPRGQS
jgi:hypothetical protein